MSGRPKLPRALDRAVKVEAGHRCAIPTCRQHPVEVAHIDPREKDGSNDVLENLIALCPTCHTRYDRGDIDRPSIRHYKANLVLLGSRYGDFERRILQRFADEPGLAGLQIAGGLRLMFKYLLDDGLFQLVNPTTVTGVEVQMQGMASHDFLAITEAGRSFIATWLNAGELT